MAVDSGLERNRGGEHKITNRVQNGLVWCSGMRKPRCKKMSLKQVYNDVQTHFLWQASRGDV